MKSFVVNFQGDRYSAEDDYTDVTDCITVKGQCSSDTSQAPTADNVNYVIISVESLIIDSSGAHDSVWGTDGPALTAEVLESENSPTGTPAVKIYLGGGAAG